MKTALAVFAAAVFALAFALPGWSQTNVGVGGEVAGHGASGQIGTSGVHGQTWSKESTSGATSGQVSGQMMAQAAQGQTYSVPPGTSQSFQAPSGSQVIVNLPSSMAGAAGPQITISPGAGGATNVTVANPSTMAGTAPMTGFGQTAGPMPRVSFDQKSQLIQHAQNRLSQIEQQAQTFPDRSSSQYREFQRKDMTAQQRLQDLQAANQGNWDQAQARMEMSLNDLQNTVSQMR